MAGWNKKAKCTRLTAQAKTWAIQACEVGWDEQESEEHRDGQADEANQLEQSPETGHSDQVSKGGCIGRAGEDSWAKQADETVRSLLGDRRGVEREEEGGGL